MLSALWLVATQHCGLEAAGILAAQTEEAAGSGCCAASRDGCATDGCETVEEGLYRSDGYDVKVGAPDAVAWQGLGCIENLDAPLEPLEGVVRAEIGERARPWVAVWVFERRAALPARAPSGSCV